VLFWWILWDKVTDWLLLMGAKSNRLVYFGGKRVQGQGLVVALR